LRALPDDNDLVASGEVGQPRQRCADGLVMRLMEQRDMDLLRAPRNSNLCRTRGPNVYRLEIRNEAEHGKDAVGEPPWVKAALLVRSLI